MSESLKSWHDKQQQELYDKQYVLLPDGTEKHVSEFKEKSVEWDEYKDLRMNSYAQDLFFSKMTDNLLINRATYYMGQCGFRRYPSTTYDEALIHFVVPELLKRLVLKNIEQTEGDVE